MSKKMLLYCEECALSFWYRAAEAIANRVSLCEVSKCKATRRLVVPKPLASCNSANLTSLHEHHFSCCE
jgi:hypothetical protein